MNRLVRVLLASGGVGILAALGWHWWADRSVPFEPFVAWAKRHAIAIKTVEPGNGFADLQPLKPVVGRARLVGVGEATHVTREFFQFKHRLLEFFVEELGFTALAFEIDAVPAARINAYVVGGEGDAATVLRSQRLDLLNTEEIVALVAWMRRHNETAITARKVKFYGFDVQRVRPALLEAAMALAPVDGQLAEEFRRIGERAPEREGADRAAQAARDETVRAIDHLVAALERIRVRVIQQGGEPTWRRVEHWARMAHQAASLVGDGGWRRERCMAQNIEWVQEQEGEAGRVMVWAHNLHVAHPAGRLNAWLPARVGEGSTMGWHLRRRFGADYVALGLSFNEGEVKTTPLRIAKVGPADGESLEGVLARVGPPLFALDVRAAADEPGAARWLRTRHVTRNVGHWGNVNETEKVVVGDCFDAVVFFARTAPTRAMAPAR